MSWKEMQEHLRRLQERRQQLESSISVDPEPSILTNVTEMIRDRELARVRTTVRRNMAAIDKQIKETIGRLGAALALAEGDAEVEDPVASFPDVVPASLSRPSGRKTDAGKEREKLLESVRDKLIQRRQQQQEQEQQQQRQQQPMITPPNLQIVHIPQENDVVVPERPQTDGPMSGRASNDVRSRVGLYHISHKASPREDQWRRLQIRILPSVSIATEGSATGGPSPTQRINVQTIRTDPGDGNPPDPLCHSGDAAVHPHPSAAVDPVAAVTADDVALTVAQILQDQLEQAFDALPIQSSHIDQLIDNGTQTEASPVPFIKDTAVDPFEWPDHADAGTQWIDPDDPPLDDWPVSAVKVAPSVSSIDQLEEGSLTPPREPIRRPEPSLPDVADWPHDDDRSSPPLERSATVQPSSTVEMSMSSSAGTSSSSLQMASHSTLPDSSASQEAISCLSEGEVLFRVPSPGQICDHPAVRIDLAQRHLADPSSSSSLSRGEVILQSMDRSSVTTGFRSPPLDASVSQGEILISHGRAISADSTLDSAALSFHTMEDASGGSSGQIRLPLPSTTAADSGSTTGDDVTHELDVETRTNCTNDRKWTTN